MVRMRAPLLLVTTGVTLALLASGAASSAPAASGPVAAGGTPAAAISIPASPTQETEVLAAKVARVNLSVDAKAGRHAISPLIYGVNYAAQTPGLSSAFTVPVDRWGGNSTSRYNYPTTPTTPGSDWYFENIVSDPEIDAHGLRRRRPEPRVREPRDRPDDRLGGEGLPVRAPVPLLLPAHDVREPERLRLLGRQLRQRHQRQPTQLAADPATTSTSVGRRRSTRPWSPRSSAGTARQPTAA